MTYRTLCPEKKVLDTTFRGSGKQRGFSLILSAVLALAVIGTLSGIAYKIRESGKDSVYREWEADKAETRRREAELSAFAAKALAEERKKRKVVVKEITTYVDKIVDRPVYRNVCLDDAGLSCLESAINGKDASGCKPDSAVRPAAAADGKGR